MSNISVLRTERPRLAPEPLQLGPATVTRVAPDALEVRLAGGAEVRAAVALPLPYQACPGDSVLVIGNPAGHYVIGVLAGQGRTVLELPGAVELRARGGPLRLASDEAVRIEAPEVEVQAGRVRTVADVVVEACASLRQRVRELLCVHAGQIHTVADGTSIAQADSTTIVSRAKVTINGKAIHLG